MKKLLVAALAMLMVLPGAALVSGPAAAAQPAADRCSAVHQFGATPVPVAKTADGATVLAHVEWGYDPSIGCYLSLDQNAVTTLRADAIAFTLPTGPVDSISQRCSAVHRFGATPVPVAKTTDGTGILAYIRWLPNDTGDCYLVLDNQATTVLRASIPEPLPELDVQQNPLSVGTWHSCAIRQTGTVDCWGNNWAGQTNAPHGQFTAISAGQHHTCALRTNKTITCWGDNWYGGTDSPAGQFTALSVGWKDSCAVATDSTITCWGGNYLYGDMSAPGGQYTAISAGQHHACAITTAKTITCWDRTTDLPSGVSWLRQT